MPKIYPKRIRKKLHDINLDLLKQAILDDGFVFLRDGGFRAEDEPFKFCNYLFYLNPKTAIQLRVGYNYPFLGNTNTVFEICYAIPKHGGWIDITPDCRQNKWRKIMNRYIK